MAQTPIKSQRLSDRIKKQDWNTCCLWETHFKYKDRLKEKGEKKIYHANTNQRNLEWLYYYQSRLQNKGNYQGQREILHNHKRVNSLWRYKVLYMRSLNIWGKNGDKWKENETNPQLKLQQSFPDNQQN